MVKYSVYYIENSTRYLYNECVCSQELDSLLLSLHKKGYVGLVVYPVFDK